MFTSETLVTVAVYSLAFAYVPGPSLVYAAAQSLAHGRRAGLKSALGIHLGSYVHIFAVAFGLATFLDHAPHLLSLFKGIGAIILAILGARLVLSKQTTTSLKNNREEEAFWHSVAIEALNPTTTLFFLAFLPQFVCFDAALPASIQMILLGIVANLILSSAEVLCVFCADCMRSVFCCGGKNGHGAAERIGGIALMLLAFVVSVPLVF